VSVAATTELVVLNLNRQQVPDLDGFLPSAVPPSRFAHFVVDLRPRANASEALPEWVGHPGITATRMMMHASNHSVLEVPPIRRVCQDRAAWRAAFRFIGIDSSILPELWHRLAHDWPALFKCTN